MRNKDEFKIIQEVIKLALQWQTQSETRDTFFMPDKEGDQIAKTRTGACSRQLLKVLAGDEVYL